MTTPPAPSVAGTPLFTEPEFAALLQRVVTALAPRVFALVEELGERVDGRIVAWGMAFENHVEVVGTDRKWRGDFGSLDTALLLFSQHTKIRLVWRDPDAATGGDPARDAPPSGRAER